jgi:hypothetical protein
MPIAIKSIALVRSGKSIALVRSGKSIALVRSQPGKA